LLDEIYLLRDVAGEREQQCSSLQTELANTKTELDRVHASRSWRLTSPLRAFARWFSRVRRAGKPGARSAVGANAFHAASPVTDAKGARQRGELPQVPRPAPPPLLNRRDGTPRLFVDITELALRMGRTGVQRVTREILWALLVSPPAGYVVEPVCASADQPYRLTLAGRSRESGTAKAGCRSEHRRSRWPEGRAANAASNPASFDSHTLELPDFGLNEDDSASSKDLAGPPMDPHPGDVFLGLDHAMRAVVARAGEFAVMRERGVRVWFVCNDTLPLAHPEWFPPEVHETFKQWFATIARVGDGIACISRATENDVRNWVEVLNIRRPQPLALGSFHLGADIDRDEAHSALTPEEQAEIDRLPATPVFLMVGTLEPRKGHAQALEAFNQLWAHGVDAALVIVGLPGWMTEVTQRRIRHHDEFGKRLFWYMDASDAMLERLYTSCTALLAPSEGEGFGLPLIEAARHNLPILCRDLPVFREVAGEHAAYFSGLDVDSLAGALQDWLSARQRGAVPVSDGIRRFTWNESARQLMNVALQDRVGSSGRGEQ
jgi:glycosyltransferase involved in cell wall biosynthesis